MSGGTPPEGPGHGSLAAGKEGLIDPLREPGYHQLELPPAHQTHEVGGHGNRFPWIVAGVACAIIAVYGGYKIIHRDSQMSPAAITRLQQQGREEPHLSFPLQFDVMRAGSHFKFALPTVMVTSDVCGEPHSAELFEVRPPKEIAGGGLEGPVAVRINAHGRVAWYDLSGAVRARAEQKTVATTAFLRRQ